MLTTTILITGGLVVAGARILLKRKHARTPVWLTQRDGHREKSYAVVVESDEVAENALEHQIATTYTLSSVSLGLNLVAELIVEPLKWFGLPIDIYNFALIIEQGYDGEFGSRRGAQLAAICVFMITFTLSDQFVMISVVQWCYFFYRKATFQLYQRLRHLAPTPGPAEA